VGPVGFVPVVQADEWPAGLENLEAVVDVVEELVVGEGDMFELDKAG
jgi:hypothetical protein